MTQDKQTTPTSESSFPSGRWHRNAFGTYEIRNGKDGTFRVRIATAGIEVVEVRLFLPSRKVELLLLFKTVGDGINVAMPLECLADERLFLTRCPGGVVTTAVPRAFALVRELLAEDIQVANHVAVVTVTCPHE